MTRTALLRAAILTLAALPALTAEALAATGPWFETPEGKVRLVSARAVAAPDGNPALGLEFALAPGWHVYWRNAGDAGYPPDLPAFNSMGYIEIIRHLRGEITLAEARQQIMFSTHRYVRHQETWLRRDPAITWLDASDPPAAHARLADLIADFLAGEGEGRAVE